MMKEFHPNPPTTTTIEPHSSPPSTTMEMAEAKEDERASRDRAGVFPMSGAAVVARVGGGSSPSPDQQSEAASATVRAVVIAGVSSSSSLALNLQSDAAARAHIAGLSATSSATAETHLRCSPYQRSAAALSVVRAERALLEPGVSAASVVAGTAPHSGRETPGSQGPSPPHQSTPSEAARARLANWLAECLAAECLAVKNATVLPDSYSLSDDSPDGVPSSFKVLNKNNIRLMRQVVRRLRHQESRGTLSIQFLTILFLDLKLGLPDLYMRYELDDLFSAIGESLLLKYFEEANPLNIPDYGLSLVTSIKKIFDSDMGMISFAKLFEDAVWLPLRRFLVDNYCPTNPNSLSRFLVLWQGVLPTPCQKWIIDDLVIPRIKRSLDSISWDKLQEEAYGWHTVGQYPMSYFIQEWLPYVGVDRMKLKVIGPRQPEIEEYLLYG